MGQNNQLWANEKKYFSSYDRFQDNSRYRSMLEWHISMLSDSNTIMDCGAGTGNLVARLLKMDKSVIALEPDISAFEVLKKKCTGYDSNLKSYCAKGEDLLSLGVNANSVDAVTSMITLPFPEISVYFSQIHKVLKEGGIFVGTAWLPDLNLYEGVFKFIEAELNLSDSEPEWAQTLERGKEFVDFILNKNITKEDYFRDLIDVGFNDIIFYESPYDDRYTLPFTCKK